MSNVKGHSMQKKFPIFFIQTSRNAVISFLHSYFFYPEDEYQIPNRLAAAIQYS